MGRSGSGRPRPAERGAGLNRRGRRAVTRIEKLMVARVAVERALDQRIREAVVRARRRGVPWPAIARALMSAPGRAARPSFPTPRRSLGIR